jgi:hypothetical protein
MHHSSRIRIGVVALLSLIVASCVPSKNPLSDPEQAAPDANLYGTWFRRDKDGARELLVIGRLSEAADRSDLPAGLMRAAMISISKDHRVGGSSSLLFFLTTTGKKTYLNAFGEEALDQKKHPNFDGAAIDSFLIMKYRLTDDGLEFWKGYSVKALGEAIEKGLVLGKVEHDKDTKAITGASLTDTTDNLVKFFERTDSDAVFPDDVKQEYRRLAIPQ